MIGLRRLLERINPNLSEARQAAADIEELERKQDEKRRQLDARLKVVEYALTPYLEKIDNEANQHD